MSLNFTVTEVPETTRVRKENEYVPLVKEMIKDEKARSFVVANKTPEDAKEAEKIIGQLQAAGRECGVSVRKTIDDTKGGKDKATVTVWTVAKITRERKADEAAE
jgi:hypothetical protein